MGREDTLVMMLYLGQNKRMNIYIFICPLHLHPPVFVSNSLIISLSILLRLTNSYFQ
ncbi:hypothetical protein BJX64DRAFT_248379 [Aspergillus heterothallicus]